MTYLLDTNIVSETRKARPSAAVLTWLETVDRESVRISVLTVGELRAGAEHIRARDPVRAEALELWLGAVESEFRDRFVPVTREVAERWGRLEAAQVARPVSPIDLLLAATALVHGWTVVTRNVRHFEPSGVTVLNPFDER